MSLSKKVLIVGASGLVGTAAANSFAASGWEVITASRRKPHLLGDDIPHIALDLKDREQCESAAGAFDTVTHVVYSAVYEKPGLIKGWRDPDHISANGTMLKNIIDPLSRRGRLRHVSLLQGTKAYGLLVQQMRTPGRESQPRVIHPNFYWLQEDYIREKAHADGFDFTIFRPQIIVGPNYGVNLNPVPIIGIYAAMRHKEGLPFSYPGTPNLVLEATDCRLVGDACVWATENKQSAGETYNLTNGEVFCWSDMWPQLAKTLGVEMGPSESISVAEYVSAREKLWREIVAEHDLQPIPLDVLLGESHHYADWVFGYALKRAPRPAFVSTIKIKQAGFQEVYNTEECVCYWLNDLIQQKILPGLSRVTM